jgi:ATP-dependent DNA helicase RecQ
VSSWVHQLADRGYLEVSTGQYPTLSLGEQGAFALENEDEVELLENVALSASSGAGRKSKSKESSVENVDQALYEKLRSWRRAAAAERAVPAYVIFHDATLERISAMLPSSVERLKSISGVGERRAEEFGPDLLQIVQTHAESVGLSMDRSLTASAPSAPAVTNRSYAYFAHFDAGKSIEETAELLDVRPTRVGTHLEAWIAHRRPESIDRWVDAKTQKKVEAKLNELGSAVLNPVFMAFGGEISFEVIRIVRAFLASRPN